MHHLLGLLIEFLHYHFRIPNQNPVLQLWLFLKFILLPRGLSHILWKVRARWSTFSLELFDVTSWLLLFILNHWFTYVISNWFSPQLHFQIIWSTKASRKWQRYDKGKRARPSNHSMAQTNLFSFKVANKKLLQRSWQCFLIH